MKRFWLILLVMFALVGCQRDEILDPFDEPIDLNEMTYYGTFENGVDVYGQSYDYNINEASWLTVLAKDEEVIEVLDMSTSRPYFLKDRKRIIYIDDVQFESIGNVIIYDSESKEKDYITTFDFGQDDLTAKYVSLIDEQSALVVVGYAYGTVTQGGLLYLLDLDTKELTEIISKEYIEAITTLGGEVVKADVYEHVLTVLFVEWLDDNYETYCYIKKHFLLNDMEVKEL